jgi:hypothetical protein
MPVAINSTTARCFAHPLLVDFRVLFARPLTLGVARERHPFRKK